MVPLSIAFGVFGLLLSLARPRLGLALALVTLYFPLLPNVPVGPLEFSVPTFLLVGLFISALDLRRTGEPMRLAGWQGRSLFAIGFSFFLSILFGESFSRSLVMIPNVLTYLLWMVVTMRLVRSEKQLWELARLILILGFLLSIWRIELRPIRLLLGLPSMGINGAVFVFHPAVAVSLVVGFLLPENMGVTRGWRLFARLVFISTIYHGLLLETRGAWLAWLCIAVVIGLQSTTRARLSLILGLAILSGVLLLLFGDRIEANVSQTRASLQAAEEGDYININPDDLIRLVARNAGLRMFQERPVFGWGPNAYVSLKPLFVNYTGKAADLPGAFNSWLISLVEWGVIGTTVVLVVFLLPLFQSWKYAKLDRTLTNRLAFSFSLGVLALSIHLLFIDLFYSFVWAHVGLALTASRFALEEGHGDTHA